MTTEFRPKLLAMSAKLDQLLTQANEFLAEPIYSDVQLLAEELHEVIVDMQARVGRPHGGLFMRGRMGGIQCLYSFPRCFSDSGCRR